MFVYYRWGHTPLDDAIRFGHDDIADFLEEFIAKKMHKKHLSSGSDLHRNSFIHSFPSQADIEKLIAIGNTHHGKTGKDDKYQSDTQHAVKPNGQGMNGDINCNVKQDGHAISHDIQSLTISEEEQTDSTVSTPSGGSGNETD